MNGGQPLSLVVTTYNNSDTIAQCLDSAAFADDILVLDSLSEDATPTIVRAQGARLVQQAFHGYGSQKQKAIDLAEYDWVLLLDADEYLSPELSEEIQAVMKSGPNPPGYRIPRQERLLWRWQHTGTKWVTPLRLFHRRKARMSQHPIHAAIESKHKPGLLQHPILHLGERTLELKVRKINHYSSGLTQSKSTARFLGLRLLFYPGYAFFREYFIRRQFLNGWAGFMAAKTHAFYAFLKYAKVLEARKTQDKQDSG